MNIILYNGTLVDVKRKLLIPNSSVTIRGEKIEQIFSGVENLPEDYEKKIDCTGKFILPGLADMHVHLRSSLFQGPTSDAPNRAITNGGQIDDILVARLHSYLYCGVTSIYDAGNFENVIFKLRDMERKGEITSPRIFCTGNLLTCPEGHGSYVGLEISSLSQDDEKIKRFISRKPDLAKITYDEHNWGIRPLIPILERETLGSIIRRCHDNCLRVTVHVSNEYRAREAIYAGADALAHPVIQSPMTQEFAWLLSEKKIPTVTTLQIGEGYSRLAETPEYLKEGFYRDCIEETERERLMTVECNKQRENIWAAWMKIMTPVAQKNLLTLSEAGGIIVTGTDGTTGPDLHRELELLQEAGLTPLEIIKASTYNSAIFLNVESVLGSVEPGKFADLVVVDQDPSVDVKNLSYISTVIKDGIIINRNNLKLPVNS